MDVKSYCVSTLVACVYFLQTANSAHVSDVPNIQYPSQWAWFSMSTGNFIGFGQNSAHPLLDRNG